MVRTSNGVWSDEVQRKTEMGEALQRKSDRRMKDDFKVSLKTWRYCPQK